MTAVDPTSQHRTAALASRRSSVEDWLLLYERSLPDSDSANSEVAAERLLRLFPDVGGGWLNSDEPSRRYLYSLIVSQNHVPGLESRAEIVLDANLYYVEPVPRSVDEFAAAHSLGAYVAEVLNHPEVRSPNVATRPYRAVWVIVSIYGSLAGFFSALTLTGWLAVEPLAGLMALLGVAPLALTAWKLGNTPRHVLTLQKPKKG